LPKSRKIVFFFPSFASSDATAPLGILAVATPLIRAGYQIVLIDSTITPNYKKRVLEEARDALCLAISLVTGPMIRETVEIAKAIKAWNHDFPIVLGGWHPSLLPTQTLQAPYIDYVVCGQGEDSFLELVGHIENNSAPDFVAGIALSSPSLINFRRPIKLQTLMHTNECAADVGRCTPLAWPARSIAPTAPMEQFISVSGMRFQPSSLWRRQST